MTAPFSPSAPTFRVVRVFISSTFRDFGEECDLLTKRVFPELRRRARERFVEVIGVDLRWGITEEESEKGETLPICLREIECEWRSLEACAIVRQEARRCGVERPRA